MEILWALMAYEPAFVCKAAVRNAPIVGPVAVQLNSIFTHRKAALKGGAGEGKKGETEGKKREEKSAATCTGDLIKGFYADGDKTKKGQRRHMWVFAEGTTSNGEQLLTFKTGGFLPLQPVVPVLFKFVGLRRGYDFDPHYTATSIGSFAVGLMAQPYVRFQVHYLPVVNPERDDTPKSFAERVQKAMAAAGNMPVRA
jgi:lysophosphatidylcholine acyltransferase / lyso-PAF acetyltransferase